MLKQEKKIGALRSMTMDEYQATAEMQPEEYVATSTEEMKERLQKYEGLEKGEFEILKPQKSFSVDEHGYACEVTKEYHFRLKINLKDFKLDADFQKGEETCYEKDMVCIIC
jgi:hypothetical protein